MKSTSFVLIRLFAWSVLLFAVLVVWSGMIGAPEWIWAIVAAIVLTRVLVRVVSHVRRVRLVTDSVDAESLGNRHRRRFEVPLAAEDAFALVDSAIRELPRVDDVESARDSLQARARVLRQDPYVRDPKAATAGGGKRRARRNLVVATVAAGERVSSITVVCEPEGAAWRDWFLVDDGTNLENIEAIGRAITRRVSEARRAEEQKVRETATEKELTQARLSLLQAQVEPHFLYNTLASAQLLTRSDAAKADEMLGNLITYLRHSVPRAEPALSTLGDEVERTRAYLEILKIRMGDRLTLNIQVPETLKPVPMPPMMLQTLAENAIKHGLEMLPGGGSVWLFARERDGKVGVTVADDGAGFNEHSAGTGIGLRNVRERLKLAYGDAASFSIVANFPRGVAATILVPAGGPPGGLHA
ncbi:MAG TPA: histidine kinase [Usitatibacter sp.]|jgi:signal transduction histidine kinase|nr:histidine kinase [Usitatibacter sp.]